MEEYQFVNVRLAIAIPDRTIDFSIDEKKYLPPAGYYGISDLQPREPKLAAARVKTRGQVLLRRRITLIQR